MHDRIFFLVSSFYLSFAFFWELFIHFMLLLLVSVATKDGGSLKYWFKVFLRFISVYFFLYYS